MRGSLKQNEVRVRRKSQVKLIKNQPLFKTGSEGMGECLLLGCHHKIPQPGSLSNRPDCPSAGGWESEIKESAGMVFSDALLLGLQPIAYCLLTASSRGQTSILSVS